MVLIICSVYGLASCDWQLVWQDEFDGTNIDEDIWQIRYTGSKCYKGKFN